jgi:hypothetical protein
MDQPPVVRNPLRVSVDSRSDHPNASARDYDDARLAVKVVSGVAPRKIDEDGGKLFTGPTAAIRPRVEP